MCTLFGYIAIDKDLNTIRVVSLSFVLIVVSPGLGAEVRLPKMEILMGRKINI